MDSYNKFENIIHAIILYSGGVGRVNDDAGLGGCTGVAGGGCIMLGVGVKGGGVSAGMT